MPKGKAFSQDLRIRAIYLKNKHGLSNKGIATFLQNMHGNTIRNYLKYLQIHGNTQSFSQIFGRKPRPRSYSHEDLTIFIKILFAFPRLTKQRMKYYLFLATRKVFKRSTIQRMLAAVLYSYKKVSIRPLESDSILIALHFIGLRNVPINRLKFVDEVHVSTKNGTSLYGYSPIGHRCIVSDYFVKRSGHTVVGIVGLNGMECHAIKLGSMNSNNYRTFILLEAIYTLQPGDYLITDNAAIHKDNIYIQILAFVGVTVWFLPPYCPHYNVIEIIWRNMKQHLKEIAALTRIDPAAAANIVLARYYNKDMTALYNQCGYY